MENQEKEKHGRIFFQTLQKLVNHKHKLDQRLLDYQSDVFQGLIIELTGTEKLLFNTLFARIAFLGIQLKIPPDLLYELHLYRKEVQQRSVLRNMEEVFQLGNYLLGRLLKDYYDVLIPTSIEAELMCPRYERSEPKMEKFFTHMKGMIVDYDNVSGLIKFISEKSPGEERFVSTLNIELFQSSVQLITQWSEEGQLPVHVALRDVGVDKQAYLYPKWIVLEPDYLVDVTAVAECFAPTGARSEYYLLNKFLPTPVSKYILIGHIVNFVLDELVNDINTGFEHILRSIFKLSPLQISIIDDKELLEIINTVKKHYFNLLRVLKEDFTGLGLIVENCVIEPSFYAPELGLQGRLDVLHRNNKLQSSIIELKSGSPFRENRYGLSANHYTQTLLYDLMIRSVFSLRDKPLNYILYSKLPHQNLRFAPTITAAQMEAISIRNEIYAYERELALNKGDGLFEKMKLSNFSDAFGFLKRDIEEFENCYASLDQLEKSYFGKMISFIALEHHYAKTGLVNHRENNGLASLWLERAQEKSERFAIYKSLKILVNNSMDEPPMVILEKTERSNDLANFRVGDIVILRPDHGHQDGRMKGQVLRGSITSLKDDQIEIKLRSKLYDQRYFDKFSLWNIESDFLDSGFRKMYQSVFSFSLSAKEQRSLILGRRAPEKADIIDLDRDNRLTDKQFEVFKKMIASPDYFLLWGPPGTGKTSIMLSASVEHLMKETSQNILLLAYTNRAVDEICGMVEALKTSNEYIRIGSKYSSGESFRKNLLESKLESIETRSQLKELINNTRIFVATTSSLSGKMELFRLKKFDVVFIDEASQILEPMLIGLLPLFKKFVLIGDHRQLPAVVVQSKSKSAINDEDLNKLGITDARTAFFDRLYQQCLKNDWHHAVGKLHEQGRMHKDIMAFPGKVFYDGGLEVLPENDHQLKSISEFYGSKTGDHFLSTERMIYLPVEGDDRFALSKHNKAESELIVTLIREIELLFAASDRTVDKERLGIITPFRAQIAQIRSDLYKSGMDPDKYTIDTVERYQGGARDIIIYSTVVSSITRLNQIVSVESDGMDRKLNVAITRAREQFILLGNKSILAKNELYNLLIESCEEISFPEHL